VVDNASDVTTESSGEGNDTVLAGITWTLGSNIEHLTLTGAGGINGTGNSGANLLSGSDGNDSLSGAGGLESMTGGSGTDRDHGKGSYYRD
jgi:Ca2+-binding RTX toxin-like protein